MAYSDITEMLNVFNLIQEKERMPNENCHDLFGLERNSVLRHLLYLLNYTYQSKCTNHYCPEHCTEISKQS